MLKSRVNPSTEQKSWRRPSSFILPQSALKSAPWTWMRVCSEEPSSSICLRERGCITCTQLNVKPRTPVSSPRASPAAKTQAASQLADFFELKRAFGSSHGRKTGIKLTQHLNSPFSFFQLQFALTLLGQPPPDHHLSVTVTPPPLILTITSHCNDSVYPNPPTTKTGRLHRP
jgi:hypothetical protein